MSVIEDLMFRIVVLVSSFFLNEGWSGGAMVLSKLRCRGILLIWIIVGQGPTALAVGAGVGCLDIFFSRLSFLFLSSSLWETARYRLKYCLKGHLSPKNNNNNQQLIE